MLEAQIDQTAEIRDIVADRVLEHLNINYKKMDWFPTIDFMGSGTQIRNKQHKATILVYEGRCEIIVEDMKFTCDMNIELSHQIDNLCSRQEEERDLQEVEAELETVQACCDILDDLFGQNIPF